MLPELLTEVPGPGSQALAARLRRCESRNVTWQSSDFPVFWERAEGVNVWDVDGNCFVDWTSAFGVMGLGHGAPEVVDALNQQSGKLLHGMGDVHPSRVKVELCERLAAFTFGHWGVGQGKCLLGNAGFEAVEAALKTAYLATGRAGVLTFENAYHGLGYGTLAAGGLAKFREPFEGQLASFGRRRPFPDEGAGPEALQTVVRDVERHLSGGDVGAVLVEPIQGRGGKVVPPARFLPHLRELCDLHGAILIFDEILTGLGRCGERFAADLFGVVPDLVCLGKGLSSGLPLSACVGKAAVMDAWPESEGEALHTTTHLGNPLACAMALAVLDHHEGAGESPSRLAHRRGEALATALEPLCQAQPRLGRVRGRGLLRGLEMLDPMGRPDAALASGFVREGLRRGLILLADSPDGHVLSLVPAFAIGDEEIAHLVSSLQEYLTSLPGSVS